jgi:acetyl esterase/lipase
MSNFTTERGIEFCRHDGTALAGDLYRPTTGSKHPVVIAIHGGGWQNGGPERYRYWGPWLAARGYAVFSITYRLVKPGVKRWPDCLHDCRAAVQFIRANAARYGIDPDRIAMVGDSAGAHLAALVALAGDRPEFANAYPDDPHAKVSTKVKVVCGVYGVYDMAGQWEHDQIHRPVDQITEKLLGARLPDSRRLFFDASPLAYCTTDNNQTAFLIAWGTDDDIVDHLSQSQAFLRALKQSGAFARPVILQGAPHFWMDDPIEEDRSVAGYLAPRFARFLEMKL